MKPLRLLYVLTIIVSLGLAGFFYAKYYYKGVESREYRTLSRLSKEAVEGVSAELVQNKKELKENLKKLAAMNKAIEALGKEASTFKNEIEVFKREKEELIEVFKREKEELIEVFKREKEELKVKLAQLMEARTILENKFHSLEELKKALKIAKLKQRQENKLKRMEDRSAQIEMLKAMDAIALAQGNRGYIIKEGEMTYKAAKTRIKVELEPVR